MSDSISEQYVYSAERDPADVGRILDTIWNCTETLSLGFELWDEPYAKGPGLYFIIGRTSVAGFADPMGTNRWPVEACANVFADALCESARSVAFNCDGAVIVNKDGTIEEDMMRLTQLSAAEMDPAEPLPYADWMGTRHMSALETSTRDEVAAAITLSEEDGRMTVFRNGTFQTYAREKLAER